MPTPGGDPVRKLVRRKALTDACGCKSAYILWPDHPDSGRPARPACRSVAVVQRERLLRFFSCRFFLQSLVQRLTWSPPGPPDAIACSLPTRPHESTEGDLSWLEPSALLSRARKERVWATVIIC